MSKSLGNVVDPLDIISDYGTDALRYTLATGTTPGQDVNLSMERVTSSRNLLNKLWNASKFVLYNLEKVSDEEWQALQEVELRSEAALAALPLAERWIVSRLHECASNGSLMHHAGYPACMYCSPVSEDVVLGLVLMCGQL